MRYWGPIVPVANEVYNSVKAEARLLAQGICIGLGSGLIFVPGVSIIAALFTKRRTMAIGIVSSASSVGQ